MKNSATFYLLKDEYSSVDDAFIDPINTIDTGLGKIYLRKKDVSKPNWASFIEKLANSNNIFCGSVSQGASISIKVNDRIIVLSFDAGRFGLQLDRIEERFGLVTCLNLQDSDKFKTIDIQSLESSGKQKKEQSPAWVSLNDFNVDINSEVVKSVTSKSSSEAFGKNVSGSDGLKVKIDLEKVDVKKLCENILETYKSDKYKSKYEWIDKIFPVKKKSIQEKLNELLVEAIKNHDEKIWMCIPKVLDWDRVEYFRYTSSQKHDDVHIEDWIREFDDPANITLANLKGRQISVYSDEKKKFDGWSVFSCLTGEIVYRNRVYVLNNSQWYEIDKEYNNQLTEIQKSIDAEVESQDDVGMLAYSHKNEAEYNEECCKHGAFDLFDRKLVNRIEVCDLLSDKRAFIHVKKYSGSSVLSHLFNQGRVSAELMLKDCKFREGAQKYFVKNTLYSSPRDPFDSNNCYVKFGIISKNGLTFKLPRFSLISYSGVKRQIEDMGYKVNIVKIEMK